MVIHQRTFYCKVGHADQVIDLVRQSKRISDSVGVQAQAERIYTDLTGKNDTVFWQVELDHLADWEQAFDKLASHPDFAAWFEQLTSHIQGSTSEFFRLM